MGRSLILLASVSIVAACGGEGSLVFGETSEPCAPVVLSNDVDDEAKLASAASCLEAAIDAGRPFTWDLLQVTVEGDPIPTRYAFDGDEFTITEDSTRDEFGSGGVFVARCATLDLSGFRPVGEDCTGASGDGFDSESLP